MKKWILITIIIIALLLTGCEFGGSGEEAPAPAEDLDILAPVRSSGLIVAEGEVVPENYAVLTFSVGGVVEEVFLDENQAVIKGDVIAQLEGRERFEAQVSAAELAVLAAQQTLDDLYENAELRSAEAQLALAEAETAYDDALDDREKLDQRWGDQDQIDAGYARLVKAEQAVEDAEFSPL